MYITHKKFEKIFSGITRLCWMMTLCLSLYVLKYTIAMNTLPLDFSRTDSVVYGMTETVFLCVAMILLAHIAWECLKKSIGTR